MILARFSVEEQAAALDDPPTAEENGDGVCVVLRIPDVDEQAATLREEGVELVADPTDHPEWRIRTVHVRDADGTLIEFNEPLGT